MAEQFIKRKAISITEDVSENTWVEGTTKSLTTGNNDGIINLAKGDIAQVPSRILITAPGAIGNLTVVFYDDTPATTAISGTLYLASQPPEGFLLKKSLQSGTLGFRIAGWTSGGATAFINVRYSY